ncbi:heavy metal-associated isoprenylated plant protein 3-like [Pistacia vera]|uniref:heavy metal-associated isoprenylated plant protein 3-like n=1 Tax=Pistacia vera TaxID=55513 RepID=UPI0012638477|nr:heavy metal-associated isoprenylated plant protein 3-like [Pistacia vera]
MEKSLQKWVCSKKTQNTTPSAEEKKIKVVLKYNAHCEHCNSELEKCIKKYSKGISGVVLNKNLSLAIVEGVFDVRRLVEHIWQEVSKRVQIVSKETAGKTRAKIVSEETAGKTRAKIVSEGTAAETRPKGSAVDPRDVWSSSDEEESQTVKKVDRQVKKKSVSLFGRA